MTELVSRTVRLRRGWLERLRGWDRLYVTKITDGHRVISGRGATPDDSKYTARRKWEATLSPTTEVTAYELQIEVQGDELTITVPASGFKAVYYRTTSQQLVLRQRTEIDDHELLLQAWEAANEKARELGWIL